MSTEMEDEKDWPTEEAIRNHAYERYTSCGAANPATRSRIG